MSYMKESSVAILKRWQALDRELTGGTLEGGLHVATFARQWKVSTRTVMRDLAAFKAIGKHLESARTLTREYRWTYCDGAYPVFISSFPRAYLKALDDPEVVDAIRNAMREARRK